MSDTTQDLEQWDPNADDTIIVPLKDDYALVVGPNTKGLEKIDGSLVGDRALNDLITSIGEGASLSGGAASAANAIQHMSGLYKLDAVTKAELAAGNALTKATDGRLIGTVRNAGGQITRQARLIPVSAPQIAGAIAAIGPAVAMVAVQMQLNNISKQVSTVQQTSLQTLQVLTDSRNADYQGDCQTIDEIYRASSSHDYVSETDWSIISGLVSRIQSHRHFYKKQVANHQEALEKAHADSHTQRDYIQKNKARIVNDSCAAFETLRAWAHLSELRIARAQAQGEHPHAEPLQIRQEVIEDLQVQRALLYGLMRELRIIAELPGGWTVPASGKRKQAHLSQQMAQDIIDILNPLVQQLEIHENPIPSPDVTCAPNDYDVSPYTKILRWYLNEGEKLEALIFPVDRLSHRLLAMGADQFTYTVNTSAWSMLPQAKDSTDWSLGWLGRKVGHKIVAPEMVAVTGRRIITADPQEFIQKGIVKEEFPINDVTPTFTDTDDALPELHLTQGEKKCREWCFPSAARVEARSIAEMLVDDPSQLQPPMKPELTDTQRDEIETSEKDDPKSVQNHQPAPNGASEEPGPEEAPTQPTA
ncbi:hypothetical protein [Isoptericola variabilis]|uniref:hypothetical protein n=1 Tax=Isoptericola variabilis TaxID=139208 RepID=UPI000660515D|nr:hypothetical protein [Isoptericola variabilis]